MKRVILAAAIVSMGLLLLGCGSSTTVKTMWTDPEFKPKETPMHGVLIMGVYHQQSTALAFEEDICTKPPDKAAFCRARKKIPVSIFDGLFDKATESAETLADPQAGLPAHESPQPARSRLQGEG